MSFSELKQKAKDQLNGKRKNAALMVLVCALIIGFASGILDAIFPGTEIPLEGFNGVTIKQSHPAATFFSSLVTIFFSLGTASYYMKVARGEEVGIDEIFSKASLFPKFFVSSLLAGLLACLGFIALIIPGIILILSYSMIHYIYIDNPEIGITEALKASREMMKGHKGELFLLGLSFIGWLLLALVTLGILLLWLAPYMGVTCVNFYESIKGNTQVAVKPEETVPTEEPKEENNTEE